MSKLGIIDLDNNGGSAPWQQDFLFLSVGQLAVMGVPDAEEFARWLARFDVGRWTSDAQGFCHRMAPAYSLHVRRKSDNAMIADWATLFRENGEFWNPDAGCPTAYPFGDTSSPYGFAAYGHAVLGLGSDLGIPGAREAFFRLRAELPGMIATFSEIPSYDIVPSQAPAAPEPSQEQSRGD
jgi:hypothetical protein